MYGTLAAWRAYATARGDNAPTAAEDADATAALVRGSDHVRLRYVANLFTGYGADLTPSGHDLPLSEEAAYIAASLELANPGFFSTTYTPDQLKVLTKVEGISWTPLLTGGQVYGSMPVASKIEALFEPYVTDRNAPGVTFLSVGGPL